MTPWSSGGPWPDFSVFAVIPSSDLVFFQMIASLPLPRRVVYFPASLDTSSIGMNSSSQRFRAMIRVWAA